MSDFDPVSDFLSREQEALGDLVEDINDEVLGNEDNETILVSNTNGTDFGVLSNGSDDKNTFPSSYNKDASSPVNGMNGHSIDDQNNNMVDVNNSWKIDFENRIKIKDAEEEIAIAELEKKGRKELDLWFKQYRQTIENRSKQLREQNIPSTVNCTESDINLKDPTVWGKVCELCDFQGKQKSNADLTRMRNILISMKA